MNCDDVMTIMDEHAETRLSRSERCALNEHFMECEPCALAWRAQAALLALPIPATPPSLLDDVLRGAAALNGSSLRAGRRARARTVISLGVLTAGAALASATLVTVVQRARDGAPSAPATSTATDSARAAAAGRGVPSDGVGAPASAADAPEYVDVDVDTVPVVRTPPIYPPAALERKLEGWVRLQFTVTANGSVDDVTVVDSSEPLFEPAAAQSVSGWRYLPRVVAGKRVAASGVETVIRFAMAPDTPPGEDRTKSIPQPSEDARGDARYTAYVGVERGIALAWERVSVEDLRGAELELDELRATYEIDPGQEVSLQSFYAYIYTQYRDYGRAITAYESAIAIADTLPGGAGDRRISLAKLYFARHQYDMALKSLLAYQDAAQTIRDPEAEELIARLRALGVTEETL